MNFYIKNKLKFISNEEEIIGCIKVEKIDFKDDYIYYLYKDNNFESQGINIIEDRNFINNNCETLFGKLSKIDNDDIYSNLINAKKLIGVNLEKIDIKNISKKIKKSYKVNVLGLGDVGGIMLAGLRLLAGNSISEIGIFDLDENKIKRWTYELNQIKTIDRGPFPEVKKINFEEVFDCDVFIFTASTIIPEVGSSVKDIRMFQYEGNSKIISIYAKKAKEKNFKGQFIVVSDPVDLLCKKVLVASEGGLLPEQIKGFGLGVMNARASYYSKKLGISYYDDEGRAYGPHGKNLIIADSILNYNEKKSSLLTQKTINANLDVRESGYKPFVAPALSSAALSILAYLEEKDHYSTVYIDGVYFGCKNKAKQLINIYTEKNNLNIGLLNRLNNTYKELKAFEF